MPKNAIAPVRELTLQEKYRNCIVSMLETIESEEHLKLLCFKVQRYMTAEYEERKGQTNDRD